MRKNSGVGGPFRVNGLGGRLVSCCVGPMASCWLIVVVIGRRLSSPGVLRFMTKKSLARNLGGGGL